MLGDGDLQLLALERPMLDQFDAVLGREGAVVGDARGRDEHVADDVPDLLLERLQTPTLNAWNKLSTDCVHASSVNVFKNRIGTYLVTAGSLDGNLVKIFVACVTGNGSLRHLTRAGIISGSLYCLILN